MVEESWHQHCWRNAFASVMLYARRAERRAATLADGGALFLAVSGLVTGLLWLAALVRPFADFSPLAGEDEPELLEIAALWHRRLGDRIVQPSSAAALFAIARGRGFLSLPVRAATTGNGPS